MDYYYKTPPVQTNFVGIYQHKNEDDCERIESGTNQYILSDGISCAFKLMGPIADTKNAAGSISNINLNFTRDNIQIVGTTTTTT